MIKVPVLVVAASVVLTACAAGDHASTNPTPSRPTTATAGARVQQMTLALREAGASSSEAECIASELGQLDNAADSLNPEEVADSVEEALLSQATRCAPPQRLAVVASEFSTLVREFVVREVRPLIQHLRSRLRRAGASVAEAKCLSTELAFGAGRSLIAAGERGAPAASNAGYRTTFDEALRSASDGCIPKRRLQRLRFNLVVRPIIRTIKSAGATTEQASCIAGNFATVDLYLPSEDFHGTDALRLATTEVLNEAGLCAPATKLRRWWRRIFTRYEQSER